MSMTPSEARERFLYRIERRSKFLKTLHEARLGIFLPADEQQRERAISHVVKMTARQNELPYLNAETIAQAVEIVRGHFEAMQQVLPHDVQYRNRIRRDW